MESGEEGLVSAKRAPSCFTLDGIWRRGEETRWVSPLRPWIPILRVEPDPLTSPGVPLHFLIAHLHLCYLLRICFVDANTESGEEH